MPLLAPDEPPPFVVLPGTDACPFVLTCDHAGRTLPRALGTLGLSQHAMDTHVAWDIGAAGLTTCLAETLGAFAILQTYSRLVIDCNRPPGAESSVAVRSELTDVPGNVGLGAPDLEARVAEVFRPYHDRIVAELDRRLAARVPTVFVALHSFTPVYLGIARPWHAGVLYQRDARLGRALLESLRAEGDLGASLVGDNQPYSVSDATDYGVVRYGERRGLLHVELEVRQDLIATPAGQAAWAARLARLLPAAAAAFLR